MYKQILGTIIIAVVSASGLFGTQIANGGFESDSNGPLQWEPSGRDPQILQVYEASDRFGPILRIHAFEGQNFVLLQSGGGSDGLDYGELTQHITVSAGQRITGAFYFDAGDYLPYDDNSTIMLIPDPCSNLSDIILAQRSVADVNSYGAMTGWETFNYTFQEFEGGGYTLVLIVEDAIDAVLGSYLAVDGLRISCQYDLAGDGNDDCKVDLSDYAILARREADFDALTIMAANWLVDCNAEPLDSACI